MAEAQLQIFLEKVRQLNAFVALSASDQALRCALRDCEHHDQVVALARRCGFDIGRRWGEPPLVEAGEAPVTEPGPMGSPPRRISGNPGQDQVPAPSPTLGLLNSPCPPPGQERTDLILHTPLFRLERIHSCAARSPQGFWYDQSESEWVTVLQGSALLRFQGEPEDRRMEAGDTLLIEPGQRHRVNATDGAPGTIWLALFWCPY
ncbi:MAG: Nif11 family protein [Cyanobium sp.]